LRSPDGLLTVSAFAQQSEPSDTSLDHALTSGKPTIYLRPRYEHVEQDGKPLNADAYTMRTMLGYRTGSWYGLSGYFEGINVGHLGEQNYNDRPRSPIRLIRPSRIPTAPTSTSSTRTTLASRRRCCAAAAN
jgi:hypothetical protein